jgi:hypothetical protein
MYRSQRAKFALQYEVSREYHDEAVSFKGLAFSQVYDLI